MNATNEITLNEELNSDELKSITGGVLTDRYYMYSLYGGTCDGATQSCASYSDIGSNQSLPSSEPSDDALLTYIRAIKTR